MVGNGSYAFNINYNVDPPMALTLQSDNTVALSLFVTSDDNNTWIVTQVVGETVMGIAFVTTTGMALNATGPDTSPLNAIPLPAPGTTDSVIWIPKYSSNSDNWAILWADPQSGWPPDQTIDLYHGDYQAGVVGTYGYNGNGNQCWEFNSTNG